MTGPMARLSSQLCSCAVFLPSRLRRWWWKACDAAWDVVGALTFVSAIAVVAFLAYMLVVSAASAMFG